MGPTSTVTACLDEDDAALLADGNLAAAERARLVEHLAGCDRCREWIGALTVAARRARPDTAAGDDDPFAGVALGRYRLIERLGAGSTGIVYRARDPVLDRDVAVKLVRHLDDPDQRRQLVAEARAMAKIAHASVVPVFDAGTEGAEVFVTSALVEGGDLRSRLGEAGPPAALLERFAELADGLAAIHAGGFVHRDVKPDNILVDPTGRLLLADLGVRGTAADRAPGAGTPAYLAPELVAGQPASPASDQFAFAVTLVEALAGERPAGWSRELDLRLRRLGVPRRTARAVERSLDPDPARRFPSMRLAADALRAARARRSRAAWLAAVALAGAAAVSLVASVAGDRPAASDRAGCDRGRERARAWTEGPLRARLADRMTRETPAAWTAVARRIDRYAARWIDLHAGACRAAARGEPGAHARLACLEERAVHLTGFLSALDSVGAAALARSDEAIWSLPPVEACAGAPASFAPPAPPPEIAARVLALGVELAAARADGLMADYPSASRRAAAVEAEARALGWMPLLADSRHVAGGLHFYLGDRAAARRAFEEAAELAERGGHDRLRALALASVLTLPDLPAERGRELVRQLDPMIDRFAGDAELVARVREHRGIFLARNGQPRDGIAELEKAAALWTPLGDEGTRQRATLELELGSASLMAGDQAAVAHFRTAVDLYQQVLAPDHPRVAFALGSLATGLGATDEAVSVTERAIAILRKRFGDRHPDTLQALTNSCSLKSALHRPDTLDRCREAVAAAQGLYGSAHDGLVWPLTALGQGLVGAGRNAEAQEVLERALRLIAPERRLEVADLEYYLAGALAEQGRSPDRALALARAARAVWAAEPIRRTSLPGLDALIAEIERQQRGRRRR